jgi:DNA-binding NtrC family response regulator
VYGGKALARADSAQPESRRYFRHAHSLDRNRFSDAVARAGSAEDRLAERVYAATLGIAGVRGAFAHDHAPGTAAYLALRWSVRDGEQTFVDAKPWSRAGTVDLVCADIIQGRAVTYSLERLLWQSLTVEEPWSRRLIVGMCNCSLKLGKGDVRSAAIALATVVDAYYGFERLRKRLSVEKKPSPLLDYEEYCSKVLAAFEPPIPEGTNSVRTLCRVVKQLPRKRRVRPRRTIDALDALITAGQDVPHPHLERRVVRQLARMLGGRVLLHRRGSKFLRLESQETHTLSTWSVLRLSRVRRIRARRVRPRPEFWRPEQRRPGGVLSFPIGDGVACIARRTPFTPREVDAVRAALRILALRRPESAGPARTVAAEPRPVPRRGRMKGLVGESRPWTHLLRQIWRVAPTDCSVVLRGETGTGKELVARALHFGSSRARGPFVALSCAELNGETFQAELFGHVRGAFTGADKSRQGLIRRASKGTLFLDELAEMPMPMQVAMLRVLQERRVRPLGSAREIAVDIRVVAATNRSLDSLVGRGTFRLDLFHRLSVMDLKLPPLRDRPEDIPLLAEHILARLKIRKTLHMDALAACAGYSWPGNVRELENVLQAAALLSDDDVVSPTVVRRILRERMRPRPPSRDRLPPRASRLISILGKGWWSAPDLADRLSVSTRTVNRELARMVEGHLVEANGEARARRYRVVQPPGRDLSRSGGI